MIGDCSQRRQQGKTMPIIGDTDYDVVTVHSAETLITGQDNACLIMMW